MGAIGSEDGPRHYVLGYLHVSLAAILARQEYRLYAKCGSFYAKLCCSGRKRLLCIYSERSYSLSGEAGCEECSLLVASVVDIPTFGKGDFCPQGYETEQFFGLYPPHISLSLSLELTSA